ncbi:MAG: hypothetical protein NZM43_07255 [Saprospiraceae bacterium]|nr:hypothetical protein [Saprospiraceae bacterium]MDW8484105.1 hypothetical protein [Saprospiraceae bacterium]
MFTPRLAHLADFDDASRVWVYVCARLLTEREAETLQEALDDFVQRWTAHNKALKAVGEVFARQFVLLMVDESQAGISGCSVDKSVHFLEAMSHQLGVDLLDRLRFGWVEDNCLHVAHRDEFAEYVRQGRIGPNTLVVNTLVQTKRDLNKCWLIPFATSWHRRVV